MVARWVLLVALLSSSAGAYGQVIDPQQDVLDRAHPEYDQIGIKLRGFTLLPSITAGVSGSDNYRATNAIREANIGLLLTSDVTWRSNWQRHRVNGNVFVQQSINAPLHDENATSFGANLSGLYDVASSS